MTMDALAAELLRGLHAQWPSHAELGGFEVEVGALLDLDADLLETTLRAAAPGVEVRIVRVEALLECEDCGAHYPPDEAPCPVCGSARAKAIAGTELGVRRAWARRAPGGAPG